MLGLSKECLPSQYSTVHFQGNITSSLQGSIFDVNHDTGSLGSDLSTSPSDEEPSFSNSNKLGLDDTGHPSREFFVLQDSSSEEESHEDAENWDISSTESSLLAPFWGASNGSKGAKTKSPPMVLTTMSGRVNTSETTGSVSSIPTGDDFRQGIDHPNQGNSESECKNVIELATAPATETYLSEHLDISDTCSGLDGNQSTGGETVDTDSPSSPSSWTIEVRKEGNSGSSTRSTSGAASLLATPEDTTLKKGVVKESRKACLPLWVIDSKLKISACYRQWFGLSDNIGQPIPGSKIKHPYPTEHKWTSSQCGRHSLVKYLMSLFEGLSKHLEPTQIDNLLERCDEYQGGRAITTMGTSTSPHFHVISELVLQETLKAKSAARAKVDDSKTVGDNRILGAKTETKENLETNITVALAAKTSWNKKSLKVEGKPGKKTVKAKVAQSKVTLKAKRTRRSEWYPDWVTNDKHVMISQAYKQIYGLGEFKDFLGGSGGVLGFTSRNPNFMSKWSSVFRGRHCSVFGFVSRLHEYVNKEQLDLDHFLQVCDDFQGSRVIHTVKNARYEDQIKRCWVKSTRESPANPDIELALRSRSETYDECDQASVAGTRINEVQKPDWMNPRFKAKLSTLYHGWYGTSGKLKFESLPEGSFTSWDYKDKKLCSIARNISHRMRSFAEKSEHSLEKCLQALDKQQGETSYPSLYATKRWASLECDAIAYLKTLQELKTVQEPTWFKTGNIPYSSVYDEWYGLAEFRDKPVKGGYNAWYKEVPARHRDLPYALRKRHSLVKCLVNWVETLACELGREPAEILRSADRLQGDFSILTMARSSKSEAIRASIYEELSYTPVWVSTTSVQVSTVYYEWYGLKHFAKLGPGGLKELLSRVVNHPARCLPRYGKIKSLVRRVDRMMGELGAPQNELLSQIDDLQGSWSILRTYDQFSLLEKKLTQVYNIRLAVSSVTEKNSHEATPEGTRLTQASARKRRCATSLIEAESRKSHRKSSEATKPSSVSLTQGQVKRPRWLTTSNMKVSEAYKQWVEGKMSDICLEPCPWYQALTNSQRGRMNKIRELTKAVERVLLKFPAASLDTVLHAFDTHQSTNILDTACLVDSVSEKVEEEVHQVVLDRYLHGGTFVKPQWLLTSSKQALNLSQAFDEWYGRNEEAFGSLPPGGISTLAVLQEWKDRLPPHQITKVNRFSHIATTISAFAENHFVPLGVVVSSSLKWQAGMSLDETFTHVSSIVQNVSELLFPRILSPTDKETLLPSMPSPKEEASALLALAQDTKSQILRQPARVDSSLDILVAIALENGLSDSKTCHLTDVDANLQRMGTIDLLARVAVEEQQKKPRRFSEDLESWDGVNILAEAASSLSVDVRSPFTACSVLDEGGVNWSSRSSSSTDSVDSISSESMPASPGLDNVQPFRKSYPCLHRKPVPRALPTFANVTFPPCVVHALPATAVGPAMRPPLFEHFIGNPQPASTAASLSNHGCSPNSSHSYRDMRSFVTPTARNGFQERISPLHLSQYQTGRFLSSVSPTPAKPSPQSRLSPNWFKSQP